LLSPCASLSPGGLADILSETWDAVVIGTGAGGAPAGFAIARQGKSVLFLERGRAIPPEHRSTEPYAWDGDEDAALRHGWWPEPLHRRFGAAHHASHHPLGSGPGGSTAVFGMVMDRFRPEDFSPREHYHVRESSLPEHWPISYDEMAPHYTRAEQLFRVHGTVDPLFPAGSLLAPNPPTPKETTIASALEACGLHPYRIHYARDRVAGCSGCAAMVCTRNCRNDAARVCLGPALQEHGAQILTECRVVRLEERHGTVRTAICEWRGQQIAVKGRVFVLAANAFFSPALLQRSANDRFPDGLANSSGMVGRNLMLHVSDFLLVDVRREPFTMPGAISHGLSLNDYYLADGMKMGNVHMHAVAVTPAMTLSFMRMHMRRINRLPAPLAKSIAAGASWVKRRSVAFATVVEDLPYTCNRVVAGKDDRVEYEYRYPHELRTRSWSLYLKFKQQVEPRFAVRPLRPVGGLNLSHVCGTCRAGDDPRSSVVDRDNRAHDLDNLYIVDASFFPSSGGINPSLTIAANSLRVGAVIGSRL
jgi:choline dehydrogenase-like flavoprotein